MRLTVEKQTAGTLKKFIPLAKLDETTHTAYGLVTAEIPDRDNEVCDYADTLPLYQAWSSEAFKATTEAGQEPSLGNIRLQHSLEIAGKVTKLDSLDAKKEIWIGSEPIDDRIWGMLRRGFVTGYSQGGRYIYRKCDECKTAITDGSNRCPKCKKDVCVRYAADPAEVSYVDSPCLKDAHFSYVKTDGSEELRKFHPRTEAQKLIDNVRVLGAEARDEFVKGLDLLKSAVTKKTKGIKFVIGFKEKGGSEVQSVIFDSKLWTETDAKQWLKDNDFTGLEVDETENSLRFRQKDPGQYVRMRTITAGEKKKIDEGADMLKLIETGTDAVAGLIKKGLRKGMYQVSQLAQLLQDIQYLRSYSLWEAEIEGGDETDLAIAEDLTGWLDQGVSILKDLVENETSELLAAKATQGDTMTLEDFVKAAKTSLAAHFKKAAAHHEGIAEAHKAHAEEHDKMAAFHKELCGKADDPVHKAHQAHHVAKAKLHEKLHKLHKAHAEHCSKMDVGSEAKADEPVVIKTVEPEKPTSVESNVQATVAKAAEQAVTDGVKNLLESPAFKDMVNQAMAAKVASLLGSQIQPTAAKAAGFELVPRAGAQFNEEPKSDPNDTGL